MTKYNCLLHTCIKNIFSLYPRFRIIAHFTLNCVDSTSYHVMQSNLSLFCVTMASNRFEHLYFIIYVQYSIFGQQMEHYGSIVITLLISYVIVNSPLAQWIWCSPEEQGIPRSGLARSTFFRQAFFL